MSVSNMLGFGELASGSFSNSLDTVLKGFPGLEDSIADWSAKVVASAASHPSIVTAMIVTREAQGLGRSLEIYEKDFLLTGIALPMLPANTKNRRPPN